MKHGNALYRLGCQAAVYVALLLPGMTACGGTDEAVAPVVIDAGKPNTISTWNETATNTINQPNAASGTPEELQSNYAFDLATVHAAMYDAVIAIAGGYQPLLVTPTADSAGASQEAAASAAAYHVLRSLFPSRTVRYQSAYDSALAAIADGDAKTRGIALGTEVAAAVVAARANDGRAQTLAPFVGGTGPGQYRGPGLVGRTYSYVRPFVMTSAAQFRAPGPLALTSAAYAADLAETAALGSTTSAARTAEQATIARFHSESPASFWPRNLRPFLMTDRGLAEQARLGALIWLTHADATIGCFESKYSHPFWRPTSAINFADTDGNAATSADPAWTPYLPTPPHPEYPAAHGCASGATAEALRRYYGTAEVSFDFSSTVSGTARRYRNTNELLDDVTIARIAGGMHLRSSIRDGQALGASVVGQAIATRFQPR